MEIKPLDLTKPEDRLHLYLYIQEYLTNRHLSINMTVGFCLIINWYRYEYSNKNAVLLFEKPREPYSPERVIEQLPELLAHKPDTLFSYTGPRNREEAFWFDPFNWDVRKQIISIVIEATKQLIA